VAIKELKYPRIEILTKYKKSNFDIFYLDDSTKMYRIHNSAYGWLFYDSGAGGRFNGNIPKFSQKFLNSNLDVKNFMEQNLTGFGTCYLAADINGALSESVFRSMEEIDNFFISKDVLINKKGVEVLLPEKKRLELVDLTSYRNRALLKIDVRIFSHENYSKCHLWAHLFYILGFDGICYEGRNNGDKCFAIFDKNQLHIDDGEDLGLLGDSFLFPNLELLAKNLEILIDK